MKLNRSYYRIYAGAKNMFAELCVKQGFIGGDWGIAQDLTHDLPEKWQEFQYKYTLELQNNSALTELEQLAQQQDVTLIYAAKDIEHNNAVVLQQLLNKKIDKSI